MAFQHQPGTAMQCLSIPIKLAKEDFTRSPQGYTDNGIYVTEVYESSPAAKCGLKVHDKILQVNGYDFTMGVTHS
ncbi:hypothetical protein MRX96_039787 [Rhipicephalus microplus]